MHVREGEGREVTVRGGGIVKKREKRRWEGRASGKEVGEKRSGRWCIMR